MYENQTITVVLVKVRLLHNKNHVARMPVISVRKIASVQVATVETGEILINDVVQTPLVIDGMDVQV